MGTKQAAHKKRSKAQLAAIYATKRNSTQLGKWRLRVLERDNNTCQQCLDPGNVAHHIQSRRYKGTRTDDDNGLTLCEHCHNALHRDKQKYNYRTGEVFLIG
jgi:5-methylcytosine-specific restriction endonuclease McrA